jgi:hypothetical protein
MLGIAMVLLQVRSPMLVSVGMYLPFGTTAAIFVGGVIRWIADSMAKARKYNEAQVTRVTNIGILIASGFISGEALMGSSRRPSPAPSSTSRSTRCSSIHVPRERRRHGDPGPDPDPRPALQGG